MDRNLGAVRAATSSVDGQAFGDLYQWGRGADGHQCRNSATTTTLSSTDQPGHGNFIISPNSPYDWRSPQNTNLWQGVNGINNPCPSGYRLPTEIEWDSEVNSWSSFSSNGAFFSTLKLTNAGERYQFNGAIDHLGTEGLYWSSSVTDSRSNYLFFISNGSTFNPYFRGSALSVRCIKN
jgi:uncharacterized protein (TIGR02145 family)